MKSEPIRLAVVLKAEEIPAWQFHLIERTLMTDYVSVSVFIAGTTDRQRQTQIRSGAIYEALLRREYRHHRLDPDACQKLPVARLFTEPKPESRAMQPELIRTSGWEELCNQLESREFDAILALEWLLSMNQLAGLAKLGVWYFRHAYGQTRNVDGASIGIWEALLGCPCTRSALVVQMPEEAGRGLIYVSTSTVDYSAPLRSRNEHLWKILFFVPRALRLIQEIGPAEFLAQLDMEDDFDDISDKSISRDLTNRSLFVPALRYAVRRISLKWTRKIFAERWELMYSTSRELSRVDQFELISPPTGRFWADPFVLEHDGSYFLFFENASVATGRGHISVMRISQSGIVEAPRKVLDRPYHLSYPFVFKWDDQIYMIPETGENSAIELYRCVNFPYQWEFVHNLMEEIDAYDATLMEHDKLWWMFVNVRQHAGASTWDELSIFYSDSPVSQNWQPHCRNPVVSDVRTARPAGRLFSEGGDLYRPSQDSSLRYGYALNINRVLVLSESEYREQLVKKVRPNWNKKFKAIHTLNRANGLTVVDVIRQFPTLRFRRRE